MYFQMALNLLIHFDLVHCLVAQHHLCASFQFEYWIIICTNTELVINHCFIFLANPLVKGIGLI